MVVVLVFYGFFGVFNVDVDVCNVGIIINNLIYNNYMVGYFDFFFVNFIFDVCVVGDLNIVVFF